MRVINCILFITFSISIQYANSQTNSEAEVLDSNYWNLEMPQIQIMAEKNSLLSQIPGAAKIISASELNKLAPFSTHEVFQKVAGIHALDEEGIGLRMNLGIRGLDPDRSSKILILEDGIPVALNPYAEPQMYYSPSIDRMKSIDILKSSGQILFGPQTIGGVINFITKDPPDGRFVSADFSLGDGNLFKGQFSYGDHFGSGGFIMNYLRKSADEFGPTQFGLHDFSTKVSMNIDDKSQLGIKIALYNETSNSTYIGLTTPMFESGLYDQLPIAPDDRLEINRYAFSISHRYKINLKTHVQTTGFAYTTERNWQRQDFTYNPISNATFIWGEDELDDGLIYMKNSNGHRNRRFRVAGLESKLTHYISASYGDHKLITGVRYMNEWAREQRINGNTKEARTGILRNDENRGGDAFSAYLMNKIEFSNKLIISLGARLEHYSFSRDIFRINEMDTSISANDKLTQLIPGLGFNYSVSNQFQLFGGFHRGFAPPRIKDAISNNGGVYQLEPELSWNSELGMRFKPHPSNRTEITWFNMDFSNQIIPVSESSGGAGSGLVNGGESLHKGIEVSIQQDFKLGILQFQTDHNVSWLSSKFNGDRFVNADGDRENINGQQTPYAPNFIYSAGLKTQLKTLSFYINYNYLSSQYTDELNTETASINGRIGKIPAYNSVDFTINWSIEKWNTDLMFRIKNVTDERYIVSRRPQGIRINLPRYINIGIRWTLDKKSPA